jgi:8-oxo-dGTP pyrophosphatase MutT (NUDIX family)
MVIPRAVAVVVDGGRVLAIRRYLRLGRAVDCVMCEYGGWVGPDCQGHRYAVLPGGHVEAGETAEVAAVRELAEETTLTAEVDRLLWSGSHNGRPAYYFLMTNIEGVATLSGPEAEAHSPDNHFELCWADPRDLGPLGIYPGDVQTRLSDLIAR